MPTIYVVAQEQDERAAIAALVCQECRSVEVFKDVSAFLAHKDTSEPGCVILELKEPASASIRRLREFVEPLPIIIVSPSAGVARAVQAMKQGAADFLAKPLEKERLASAVGRALDISRTRMEQTRRKNELLARYQTLSEREKDVVGAVLDGRPNREVALQLGIRPRTVEIHRSNAMAKLGARTLPELVRIWLDLSGGEMC